MKKLKNIGAGHVSAHKEKGITLVALIITIIVMLILVGVSIQVVINSNLIGTAEQAAQGTETKYQDESSVGSKIEIDGKEYASMDDYIVGVLEGEGTEENPYIINNIESLIKFAHNVTNGKTYEGEYVKLTRNLDFKSADSYINATRTDYEEYGYVGPLMTALTTGKGWIPIGAVESTELQSYNFAGTFDGNGKTIKNLYINANPEGNISKVYVGLFGCNYGVIKNLGLVDGNVDAQLKNDVSFNFQVGMLAGMNFNEINGCYTTGQVSGVMNGSKSLNVGGIAGQATGIVKNCYNKANIPIEVAGTGYRVAGGIVGADGGESPLTIENCYNSGLITFQLNSNNVNATGGGVVGVRNVSGSSMINCYNVGIIQANGNANIVLLGGISGQGFNISNCYNKGNIVSEVQATTHRVGGILGQTSRGDTVGNAYYLASTAEKGVVNIVVDSTANITSVANESNMPTVLEIIGNAFKAGTGSDYPILSWE